MPRVAACPTSFCAQPPLPGSLAALQQAQLAAMLPRPQEPEEDEDDADDSEVRDTFMVRILCGC